MPIRDALAQVRARQLGSSDSDPRRTAVGDAVARLAAATLVAHVGPGARVNIGTGLPEGVAEVLFDAGLHEPLTLLVESGPVGGVPASGVYFGASLSPQHILSSAEMFRLCYDRLDATCLGVLEADGEGNVNVSRRSEGVRDYVGPGGFIDLTTAARMIVFVSDWMVRGEMQVENGVVRVLQRGAPKFVERVARSPSAARAPWRPASACSTRRRSASSSSPSAAWSSPASCRASTCGATSSRWHPCGWSSRPPGRSQWSQTASSPARVSRPAG